MTSEEHQQQLDEQQHKEEKPMGIIASNKGESNYKPAPEGAHLAICTMMVDLGIQQVEWKGETKNQHKVYIGFSLINEPLQYEKDGETIDTFMTVGQQYTLSLNEKAKLRQHLEAWRGKKFTGTEEAAFDITAVLGKPCTITIVHNESNGNTYANIASISALMKGIEVPEYTGDLICYHSGEKSQEDKLPNWIKQKLGLIAANDEQPVLPKAAGSDFDDDIPF